MITSIFAKSNPEKTLIQHMTDAGCVAIEILNTDAYNPVFTYLYYNCNYTGKEKESFLNWIATMVALHDIGKADIKFQSLLPTKEKFFEAFGEKTDFWPDNKFRHEIYGQKVIRKVFKKLSYNQEWSCIVRLHHQKSNADKNHNPDIDNAPESDYFKRQEKWILEIIEMIQDTFNTRDMPEAVTFTNKSSWWSVFSGFMILCDWISSSEQFVVKSGPNYKENATIVAKKIICKFGLEAPKINDYKSFEECFGIKKENMRGIQKACEDEVPYDSKLIIIEAATGEGKTEAALYTALKICKCQGKSGIYVGLPTAATSNQMFQRVKTVLVGCNIKLVHSSAWLLDDNASFPSMTKEAMEWMSSTKRGILCQNAVGTIDQTMKAVLRIKFAMLKLLGLLNKVVILDEIHAYDSYMKSIIKRMLLWFKELGIPVIMLSATLPDGVKKEYVSIFSKDEYSFHSNYPLITCINSRIQEIPCKSFKKEKLEFIPLNMLGDYEAYANYIAEVAKDKGYIVCICNTVEGAQETYKELKKKIGKETDLYLLHSKFTIEDREKIEYKLSNLFSKKGISGRPGRCILITTQIVEQSLDYDFDIGFSEIAPIDLLIQRFGRIKRFGNMVKRSPTYEGNTKKLFVFIPNNNNDYGNISYVYYELLLKRTQELITKNKQMSVPEDIRSTINYVYHNALDKDNFELWSKMYSKDSLEQMFATSNVLPEPDAENLFWLEKRNPVDGFCRNDEDGIAVTRMGDATIKVVFIQEQKELEDGAEDFAKAKKLHKQAILITPKENMPNLIEGKGYAKGMFGILSSERKVTIGNILYEYENEFGLKKA